MHLPVLAQIRPATHRELPHIGPVGGGPPSHSSGLTPQVVPGGHITSFAHSVYDPGTQLPGVYLLSRNPGSHHVPVDVRTAPRTASTIRPHMPPSRQALPAGQVWPLPQSTVPDG